MEIVIKESISKANPMEKEDMNGIKEVFTKVSLTLEWGKVEGNGLMKMESLTKVNILEFRLF